jgi:predicted ATPase
MIRAIHVANFRSLGESVSLELPAEPPYVLVLAGLNGAGKSNVLDVFRFLREALPHGLAGGVRRRGGFDALLRQGADRVHVVVEAVFGDDWTVWGAELAAANGHDFSVTDEGLFTHPRHDRDAFVRAAMRRLDPRHEEHVGSFGRALFERLGAQDDRSVILRAGHEPSPFMPSERELHLPVVARGGGAEASAARRVLQLLEGFAVYDPSPDALRQPQLRSAEPLLEGRGENWASVLQRVLVEHRTELSAGLSKLQPDLFDLQVDTAGDHLVVSFEHRPDDGPSFKVPANRESDGTLRAAALLCALLQEPPPSVLCVEEPENAIHAWAMPAIADYVLTRAESVPVIVTTQSRDVLDLLPVEAVRVVERDGHGTRLQRLSARQASLVRGGVSTLGELLWSENLLAAGGDG